MLPCHCRSLTNGLPSPFDVHFTFLLMSLINVAPVLIALGSFSKDLDLPIEAAAPGSAVSKQPTLSKQIPPVTELVAAKNRLRLPNVKCLL